MKVTVHPTTGELSFDVDSHNRVEVEQAIAQAVALAMSLRNGHSDTNVRTLVFLPDRDDDLAPEDLIAPSNAAIHTATPVSEDERIAAGLQTREQLETWMYLRRNDRVRGVALTGLANRFKLTSTAASARCATLVKLGYAIRVSKGYYRAIVPDDI